MKTFTIGDIHGGLKSLIQVLERSNFDNSKDKLIFLGDYVDGWSESAELIEYLINLQEESNNRHIFLRGNHDKWCEDWLNTGIKKDVWYQQGGKSTIESYIKNGYLTNSKHRLFFHKLHNYYIDDKNRGFVHGGFVSKNGLGHDLYASDYYWDRDMFELALMLDNNPEQGTLKSRRFEKHHEVYIGHTSTCSWKYKHNGVLRIKDNTNNDCKVGKHITTPIQACNVWNLDTGGGWFGKLTIMDIDSKEYWQSDFVKELYPHEKGRN